MKPPVWWELRPWRRHSLVVAIGGLVYLAYGVLYLFVGNDPAHRILIGILGEVPAMICGTVWIVVGALALLSARWPPTSETWGYTCLSGLAALWASGYATSWVFLNGPSRAVGGALVWGLVSVLWWGISGLRNPDDMPGP